MMKGKLLIILLIGLFVLIAVSKYRIGDKLQNLCNKYDSEAVAEVNENIDEAVEKVNHQISDAVENANEIIDRAVDSTVDNVKKSLWESFKEAVREFFGTFLFCSLCTTNVVTIYKMR